jgi:hypothetical protein
LVSIGLVLSEEKIFEKVYDIYILMQVLYMAIGGSGGIPPEGVWGQSPH